MIGFALKLYTKKFYFPVRTCVPLACRILLYIYTPLNSGFVNRGVEILSELNEGLYGWITVNYLMEQLHNPRYNRKLTVMFSLLFYGLTIYRLYFGLNPNNIYWKIYKIEYIKYVFTIDFALFYLRAFVLLYPDLLLIFWLLVFIFPSLYLFVWFSVWKCLFFFNFPCKILRSDYLHWSFNVNIPST